MTGFLSSEKIKENQVNIFENEYDETCIKEIMYDLRLGNEIYVTPNKNTTTLKEKQNIVIKPGQYALLTTQEKFKLSNKIFGLITIKMKYKEKGLVNISGFHVDPGFKGNLVFSVINLGPLAIVLRAGDEVFSILFYELEKPVLLLKDRHIEGIPIEMLEPLIGKTTPSIIELKEKIESNSRWIRILQILFASIFVELFLLIFYRFLPFFPLNQ